ncbi:hypothetical protein HYH03_010715 [Edaphochlamys debaryana]|uniref:Uncharacterized protein n=1 Tax=Edaphochlamys debaryana TaxID=47281 RepID=A0A835XXG4_9CHLO|nr:hypothetical protein HYH03_010715 [Edaphochlamys debaryana]|eukprot:KAG2490793.1 hypothetical protein HYH03_010715 [Edaphochlamys debaryana]
MLRLLPSSARDTLASHLIRYRPAGRLACRALRDFIDGELEQLDLDCNLDPTELGVLAEGGRWLERWPRCRRLTIRVNGERQSPLVIPFAAASPDACRRIQELEVLVTSGAPQEEVDIAYDVPTPAATLSSGTLVALLSRLPKLTTLTLSTKAPDEYIEQSVARHALSLLPKLTNLTVAGYDHLACIPGNVGHQLTCLCVESKERQYWPTAHDIMKCLSPMTCLRRLTFHVETPLEEGCEWDNGHSDFLDLLDFCTAELPQLQALDVWPVAPERVNVGCTLAGGVLTAFKLGVTTEASCDLLSRFWTYVLQPCRALGSRRLPLLELDSLSIYGCDEELSEAVELVSRCDRVTVKLLCIAPHCNTEGAVSLLRLLGAPQQIRWGVRHEAWKGYGVTSLSPVRCTAVTVTVYRRLPGAGAVLLTCSCWFPHLPSPGVPGEAVAEAAFKLAAMPLAGAQAAARAGGGGADAEPVLEARLCDLSWDTAVEQVLQAWWDGEEQGGAGGAAAPSGSGGGGRAPWPQLERVRLLLEMVEGLRGSVPDMQWLRRA